MNNINLSNIEFPVFRVGTIEPTSDSGVLFFLLGKDTEYSDAQYDVKILDDKNRPEATLAGRRLAMKEEGITLYTLSKAIFFLGDLIKLAKKGTWFIDWYGNLFQYHKSKMAPLVFKRIKNVIPITTGGALIEVEGFTSRFKVLYKPNYKQKYAGILLFDRMNILYGLYEDKLPDYRRAV